MSFEDKIFVIPASKVDVNEGLGLVILILNVFSGSLGTLLSALIDKKGLNTAALLVWLLQFLLSFIIIGWVWGILHGYAIYRKSVGKS